MYAPEEVFITENVIPSPRQMIARHGKFSEPGAEFSPAVKFQIFKLLLRIHARRVAGEEIHVKHLLLLPEH